MNDSTITLKLWQVSGTDKAYLFSTTPAESREGFKVWIPISQIEHITRRPNGCGMEGMFCGNAGMGGPEKRITMRSVVVYFSRSLVKEYGSRQYVDSMKKGLL